ncbi:MAG TPA: DUF1003 domain-containing protein [Pyrinomonadaceae bacterium]|nr:DUF1003 domain-containing protein [Pyrinomonadaceae bacterium]
MTDKNRSESALASGGTQHAQAQKNVEDIMRLEQEAVHSRSPAEHVADRVTTVAGSTPCLVFHVVWFSVWIILNVGLVPRIAPFDPFPFSFLTLVVSLEAIFLTLLVLMSQNRMTKEADKRAHLDLQVNMLAEQEATMILRMVQRIGRHIGLEDETDEDLRQLEEKTDVHQLAKTLDEKSG